VSCSIIQPLIFFFLQIPFPAITLNNEMIFAVRFRLIMYRWGDWPTLSKIYYSLNGRDM
jgi:hypothetical protein